MAVRCMPLLQSLVDQSQVAAGEDRHTLEDWSNIQKSIHDRQKFNDESRTSDEDVQTDWKSVLDKYDVASATSILPPIAKASHILQTLQEPRFSQLTDLLIAILSSPRSTDEISEELVELMGLENIELVTDILRERTLVLEELSDNIMQRSRPDIPQRVPSNDRSAIVTDQMLHLSPEEARRRMGDAYRQSATRHLFSGVQHDTPERLPHIYTTSTLDQGNVLSYLGSKYMLPKDTVRTSHEDFEEVIIPPAKTMPLGANESLVLVSSLDPLVKGCFAGYDSLNRMQSIVYPTAYRTNENLLISAPTGAGKTDVAMLTILRVINQHRRESSHITQIEASIDRNAFKIIYVAPMKALAAEIVRKLQKRLRWLGIRVRELTGDMQMTKNEIAETQIIVTTPEKWDVVTRKPTGEGEIASSLKLLIIDEVHLLNEERGAVVETIVARTLRQVETSQSVIRIVGLSATLPNYTDIADFLCVSRQRGLFYFDSSFRPIPLEQHFLGIKGKPGSAQCRRNFDRVTFEKVSELVSEGHQVMVFVHARKETVKTALSLMESATIESNIDDFSCRDHPRWELHRRSVSESRNKEMKRLFDGGFGIHHAGMLRSDRNLTEMLFQERVIKVLCCTATLAWGVNLPAHAVIIKGTEIYDSSRGSFVDLSVLDVLQIFGRAGRPGLESSGEGYICTTEDKLSHYLDSVLSQIPIESQFQKGLVDALNAEVSLGTVSNVHDAVRWLGYTYLFVRMRKNPLVYGVMSDDDGYLGTKRNELVIAAANLLAGARMIVYDAQGGSFYSTDLGRIAARYYIRHASIETFNKNFRPVMTEADVLAMLCMSIEFDQVQVRENEIKELEQIMERVPCDVKGGTDTNYGKANILLQGYISRDAIEDFALVSDTAYVAQNSGRIVRALLEIALSKKWSSVSSVLLNMSKAIELRMWPYEHPLKQQFNLKNEVIHGLDTWAEDWSITELAESDPYSLGQLIHLNERHGTAIASAAKQFPSIRLEYDIRPLGPHILKISVRARRHFVWNANIHGGSEIFLLWVENEETSTILQMTRLIYRATTGTINSDFIISIAKDTALPRLMLRSTSDRWIGADEDLPISLDSIVMPASFDNHTVKLNLSSLRTSIFKDPVIESMFSHINYLNGIQTQTFWSLTYSQQHSLICGPASSGKSTLTQIAIWTVVMQRRRAWVLVIAPRRSIAIELLSTLRRASRLTTASVEYRMGPDILIAPKQKAVYVVTAAQLFRAMCQANQFTELSGLDLVVCDNLEQLGASYELAVSLLRHATQSYPTRFIGTSNCLDDPSDLADWLNVQPYALHSFKPKDRDQALGVIASTISLPYSPSQIKAMVKPVHNAAKGAETAIVFVPSQGHCRTVALGLLTQCALETESTRGYLSSHVSPDLVLQQLDNMVHRDFISKGVGFFHEGVEKQERDLMLRLFLEGVVRVLIVPREACWTVPVRAEVVIVMGCQYLQSGIEGSDSQIRDYELTEVVQMQSRAIRQFQGGHFYLFCQPEVKDTYLHFLNEGLPLESRVLEDPGLETFFSTRVQDDSFGEAQALDVLSFTYLARRVASNPSFYGCASILKDENLSLMVDRFLTKVRSSIS
ncbi:hypothetical protein AX17_001158 [Amanita inopinata Kibby_2008]|nr:hypothetical protein AX17_001158 [Amanita inopinata Kibby_2008]